jgi:NAD+ diphosphatase
VAHRNVLSTHALDRIAHRRNDADWLRDIHASRNTQVVVVWNGKVAVTGTDPTLLDAVSVQSLIDDARQPVLLGELAGTVHIAVDLSHLSQSDLEAALPADAMLSGLRDVTPMLTSDAGNLLAMASALMTWHGNHRHCGRCGAPTVVRAAGHERHCDACGYTNFPRTDPAVIMLAVDGDRCVLGRQKIWPQGMYSTLAGFVEPGESLEDAVAREVLEEVGLAVAPTSVRYHSSQPWPFPQSIMLGFLVDVDVDAVGGANIVAQESELEDARWFTRQEIEESIAMGRRGFPMVPPPITIARSLIDAWLNG